MHKPCHKTIVYKFMLQLIFCQGIFNSSDHSVILIY